MNWFQQGIADGERRGESRGRTEGRREGERAAEQRLVLKQLRLRFMSCCRLSSPGSRPPRCRSWSCGPSGS